MNCSIRNRGWARILIVIFLLLGFQANHAPVWAGCPTTTRGVAVWSDGSDTAKYNIWDGSSFGREGSTATMGDRWVIMQAAAAPSRDEKIVAGIANNKSVTGAMWNGSTWSALPDPPGNPLGTVSENIWWGIDVAYEQQSGDAVLVWNDNPNLKYSVWNGGSWTTAATVSAYAGGEPQHMHIAAKPNSDEMLLVVNDVNAADYALVWDGSNWGNALALDSSGNGEEDQTAIYVAYEQQNGRAVVVYGKDADANGYYRIWNGSSWDPTEGTITAPGSVTSQARWLTLGSDPSSNRMALGVLAGGDEIWLSVWDGTSSWAAATVATTSAVGTDYPNIAVAFQSQGSQALATYGVAGSESVFYRTWTSGGGWSNEQTRPNIGGVPNFVMLDADHDSDSTMLSAQDGGNNLNYVLWSGSTRGTPSEQEDNTGENTHQPFVFLWNRNEGIGDISTVALSPIKDTYLSAGDNKRDFGSCTYFQTDAEANKPEHALLQFDLSSLPSGCTIDTASLVLTMIGVDNDTSFAVNAHRVTSEWVEGTLCAQDGVANWNNRTIGTPWVTPGGDYDATVVGSTSVSTVGVYTWDVSSLVQGWINNTYPNYGLLLRSVPAPGNQWKQYASRENGTSANQPRLEVTYTCPEPPMVDAVALYQSDRVTPATAMDPQVEYAVGVTVTDVDTLADLSTVKVTIFFDTDGDDDPGDVPGSGDTQNAAILTCTVGDPPVWSIDPGAGTTWAIVEASSVQPALTSTTGDFWFHFRPGKVATQATDWDVYAVADDGGGSPASLYDGSDYDMNWYGEITVNTASVDWGVVGLGSDFDANAQTGISVTYISNGNFNQQVRSDATWSSGGASIALNAPGSPGAGEFSLKADDSATLGSAVPVSTSYAPFDSGSQTAESGHLENTNTLWLKMGPSGIPALTYSGNLYYQIAP